VIYFLNNYVLTRETTVEALGWAEDMRHELKLRPKELEASTTGKEK
jgi:hypothetical protein